MLGQNAKPFQITTMDIDYVCVKAAMFSFSRLRGADPITGVEMASTGADSASVPELQVRVDGVGATPRHRDAVDVAVREPTRLVREPRPCRDGINQHR